MKQFVYHGKVGKLFVIWFTNVLFTLLTLGIYFFWARVRTKKYFYENTSFDGKYFGYHATGKERLFGFLKGVLIFTPFYVLIFGIFYLLGSDIKSSFEITLLISGLVFIFLLPIIIVGSRRFDLIKTSWNQNRFYFSGKTNDLYKIFIKGILFSVITFGIYGFWFANNIYKFKIDHSQYGSEKFSFQGKGIRFLVLNILGVFLTVITFGIFSFWYRAMIFNFKYSNISIQGKSIQSTLEGADLFLLALKSIGIMIVTLGIGFPIVKTMQLKLLTSSLSLEDSIDLKNIKTISDKEASAIYQGVEEVGNLFNS